MPEPKSNPSASQSINKNFTIHDARRFALASLSGLSEAVSHWINNQLAIAYTSLELLEEDITPNQEKLIKQMRESLEDLSSTVSGIKKFASATVGVFDSIAMNELLEDVLKELKAATPETVTWHKEFGGFLPEVMGSSSMLRQVLKQLMEHCLLMVKELSKGEIWIKLRFDNDKRMIIMELKDNGLALGKFGGKGTIGLFFSNRDYGRKYDLGMALMISNLIVEAHGGSIKAEDGGGTGMLYTLSLPVAEGH